MLDRILAKLGLLREKNYVESMVWLRQAHRTVGSEPMVADRDWRYASSIAHGRHHGR